MDRGACWASFSPWGRTESETAEQLTLSQALRYTALILPGFQVWLSQILSVKTVHPLEACLANLPPRAGEGEGWSRASLKLCAAAGSRGSARAHSLPVSLASVCGPRDSSPPRSVRGILQARILERAATSSSRGPPDPGTRPAFSAAPTPAGGLPQRQFQTGRDHFLEEALRPLGVGLMYMEVSTEGWGGHGHKGERCWVDGALRATVTPWDLWAGTELSREVWSRKAGKRKHQKAGTHWPEKCKAINCDCAFNITVIQVYAPTTDAEEAELFYNDL